MPKRRWKASFITQFIKGKIKPSEDANIFTVVEEPKTPYETPLKFSPEVKWFLMQGAASGDTIMPQKFPSIGGLSQKFPSDEGCPQDGVVIM